MLKKIGIVFCRLFFCIPFMVVVIVPFILIFGIAWGIMFGFPLIVKAEMQPFYNFEVTIDRAEEDQFNEKIEVYVEKDGQYYGDYDLNRSNSYCYRKEMETGEYRLYARVRYDQSGDYEIDPEYQDLKIGGTDYEEMHRAVFSVRGGEIQEIHDMIEESEYKVPADQEVYTMDRLEELKEIQEDTEKQVEKAFYANEQWEREHSFLAQHHISDPNIADRNENAGLSSHYYPDREDMSQERLEESEELEKENIIEETMTELPVESTLESQEESTEKELVEQEAMGNAVWCGAGVILLAFTGAGLYLRKKR